MKRKLLFLLLLAFGISFAKPNGKSTLAPSIGITLQGQFNGPNLIMYTINIKNTGDEPLTNIIVSDPAGQIAFQFSPIATMAPGQEILNLQANAFVGGCFDASQILVTATTLSSATITDLSADPFGFDNNGQPGTYYNDCYTYTMYSQAVSTGQDATYQDLNNNGIVDVGDSINYAYSVNFFSGFLNGSIADNNAVVLNPTFNAQSYSTTGIHFLTQAEVDLGYVYNTSSLTYEDPCGGNSTISFQDNSFCNACPNPTNANIITQLTSLLPNQISGKVKFNANNDNCTTGLNFPQRRVSTTDGTYNYASYTNSTGDYSIWIPNSGNYSTAALTNLPVTFSSSPATVAVTSSGSGINYNNTNFCISSATNYADLRVNMFNINQAIPGNVATYRICLSNLGSTNLSGSVVLNYNNGKISFSTASPVQSSSTANTVTWNYTNLLPFEIRYINLSFNVLIPPTTNAGDILAFTLTGNPTAGDANIADNTFTMNQSVFSSFDPNDKTVIEGPSIPMAAGVTNKYLTYVTRFQNTGTANASTIVIKETLDPKLDWNSFEPIASSHVSHIEIKNGNDLTYTFSNINLPYQSANEPASHGWMAYRIKPRSNIAAGDVVSSHSNIYFDYNAPITTNTVTTQYTALATNTFITSNFALYPNPASSYIVIENKSDVVSQYEIIDINGKLLQMGEVENLKKVDVSILGKGFYFITIKNTQGKATYKFIKN